MPVWAHGPHHALPTPSPGSPRLPPGFWARPPSTGGTSCAPRSGSLAGLCEGHPSPGRTALLSPPPPQGLLEGLRLEASCAPPHPDDSRAAEGPHASGASPTKQARWQRLPRRAAVRTELAKSDQLLGEQRLCLPRTVLNPAHAVNSFPLPCDPAGTNVVFTS